MKRTVALTAGMLLVALGSPARASDVVVDARRISDRSPIAGTCAPTDRSPIYGEYTDAEEESSLAVNPSDPRNIVISYLQDAGLAVVVSTTRNGGATWRHTVVPGLTKCTGGELDRVVHTRLSFGPDGVVYLATHPLDGFWPDPRSGVARVAVNTSFDGGETWTQPSFVSRESLPVLNDFDTIAAEPDVPGAVDVVWSPTEAAVEPIVLSRSIDHGRTWTHHTVRSPRPAIIAGNRVLAHPDGTLMVFTLDQPVLMFAGAPMSGPFTVARSSDKGRTWSEPSVIADAVDTLDWPLVSVSPEGVVYAAWRMRREGGRTEVLLRRSLDAGLTWSTPTSAFTYMPATSVLPELAAGAGGSVALAYYDADEDAPGGAATAVPRFAYSRDGGATWGFSAMTPAFGTAPEMPYLGLMLGLDDTPCGFAAGVPVFAPVADIGPTDMIFATAKLGPCSPAGVNAHAGGRARP